MHGRREFGVAALAEISTREIVKPSSPACAARLGAPLAMAESKRKRAYLYGSRLIDLSQGDPVERTYNKCEVNAVPIDTCSACLPTLTGTWEMQLMSCWAKRNLTARLADKLQADFDALAEVQPADDLPDRSCHMKMSRPLASHARHSPWLEARSGQAYMAGRSAG